jgi:YHS domain-containing protein
MHSRKGRTASFYVLNSHYESDMNRTHPASPAVMARGNKHRTNLKWKPSSQSLMKFAVVVSALGMLTSYKLNAAELEPDLPVGDTPQLWVWFEKGTHKLNVDAKGVILKGYDPVAYFTQHRAVKGNPKHQTTYQGATYYFNSAADLAIFKKSPSNYVPQYGGFCANSMKDRKAADTDPTVFFITKGKLYVCTSPAAEQEFRAHEGENIKKADQNWGDQYEWFY